MEHIGPNYRLKAFDLSENFIGKNEEKNVVQPDYVTGGEAIAMMLTENVTLTRLNVAYNYIRQASAGALARALATNGTSFTLLRVSCSLDQNGFHCIE